MQNSEAEVKDERKSDDFINGDQVGGEITEKEYQIKSTKAAICEVREENERLKTILAQIVRDYQSLQMQFLDIMKQEHANIKTVNGEPSSSANKGLQVHHEEHELVSLCLGSSSEVMKKQQDKTNFNGKAMNDITDYQTNQGLTLGLECQMQEEESDVKNEVQYSISPENSSEGTTAKEVQYKAMKSLQQGEEEVEPLTQVKKARVSVRARCDAPTMNDGCQWRKYGQKIAKGNPCPRAYYRCTVAPGCPVRKQVQRCAEDMSILISTYEGNHNHPLPISATAMASTTAAAASMLISGSSLSLQAAAPPHSATGLNFYLPDSSNYNGQFYFTNPSIAPSHSQPTITLDLTNPAAATAYQPNRLLSSSRNFYSPASFNFSHSELSSSWNSSNGYLGYGAHQPYYKSYNIGAMRQLQESLLHPHEHKASNPTTETIAKAITSDPSFQSALAAAITSYVGGSVAGAIGDGSSTSGVGQLPFASSLAMASNLACSTSSNLNKLKENLVFFPPTLGPSSSEHEPNASPPENSSHKSF